MGFAFGADTFEQHRRRLVIGVLRYELTTEGFGEDGLVELIAGVLTVQPLNTLFH